MKIFLKKGSIVILLLHSIFHYTYGFSQYYDTLISNRFPEITQENHALLNFTDASGNRQGKWIQYIIVVQPEQYYSNNDSCFILESSGYYNNNQKTGTWEYYGTGSHGQTQVIRIAVYYEDHSVVEKIFNDHASIYYNIDSSIVTAIVNSWNKNDTFAITCSHKSTCILSYREQVITEFQFDWLYLEIEKILLEVYNRERNIILRTLKE